MQIHLSDRAKHALVSNLFPGTDEKERCGVLIGHRDEDDVHIVDALYVVNSADSSRDFAMRESDVRTAVEGAGYKEAAVIGAAHTHKRGTTSDPSWEDVEYMTPGMLGAVFHETSGMLTYYNHEVGYLDKEKIR